MVDIKYDTELTDEGRALKSDILKKLNNYELDDNLKAIFYKIDRLTDKELEAYKEYSYSDWDDLTIDPKNKHTGNIAQTTAGKMYWGWKDKPQSFGYLKFPLIDGKGCQSFDMTMPDYDGGFVKCDTVVFGCYVNDTLRVVKYFIDESKFTQDTESNFEDVMIIGQWEETKHSGDSKILGYLYTTDFDDRKVASESESYTTLEGKDLGYGQPTYQTPAILYMWGGLSRARYYSHKKTIKTKSGTSLSIGICIPVLCRDAILYAFNESAASSSYYENMAMHSVNDPTSYEIWTYDPIFHWIGGKAQAVGYPSPKLGEYVYAVYFPPPESTIDKNPWYEFAYSGNWFGVPERGYKDVSAVVAKYTYRYSPYAGNAMGVVIGGESPQIETYTINKNTIPESKGMVGISLNSIGSVKVHSDIPDSWYFSYSPVDVGGTPHYFYRDAQYNAFGINYSSTSEGKDGRPRTQWGESALTNDKNIPYFIGVVNE